MPLAPLLPTGTLDYTGLTREDLLSRLRTLFNQVNPDWDDFTSSYPENLLLEGNALIADVIRGAMEERVRQVYPATRTDRLAAIREGRLTGFKLTGAKAATVTLTFSIPAAISYDITIPKGTRVRTAQPNSTQRYITTAEAKINLGSTSVSVSAENAEEHTETHQSDGSPFQVVELTNFPYLDGSLTITDSSSTSWTEKDTLTGSKATDKHYVVLVDNEGRARIQFGNDIQGAIPTGTLTLAYKTGGGVSGEVSANASWVLEDTISDSAGNAVSLTVTNSAASSSAEDAMTVDEARILQPQSLRTVNRCVTEADFEYVALQVSGIARAMLATSNHDSSIAEDTGILNVVALGTKLTSGRYEPATPTTSQLDEIASPTTGLIRPDGKYPPIIGFKVSAVAATFRTINVEVRIYKESGYQGSTVKANIEAALKDLFAVSLADKTPNPEVDFGAKLLGADGTPDYKIAWSTVLKAIQNTDGVKEVPPGTANLLLNGANSSIILKPQEFPKLGTITVRDEDASGAIL